MPANPEAQALLEQALKHVLAEQSKVLLHKHRDLMIEPAQKLGVLASEVWNVLSKGFHKIDNVGRLRQQAIAIEEEIDDISEQHWFYISISISSIFERVQESFTLQPIQERLKLKAAIAVRNHFHNLRLLLLEQLLSARMLINNADYGSEIERVWQQFLQRELGPEFRVLQGGHILDFAGNNANAQIDLLVVPADAHVITPSSLEDGKVNVLCDQVIAAIMTTSNLTNEKAHDDWIKLDRVSKLFSFKEEFPGGTQQAWPLCYLIAGQSIPIEKLKEKWINLVKDTPESSFVPQFLISLDSGYLYSGATSWPRPRYPSNYVNRDEVMEETGIYAGLGIAWLLTQIRARAKLLQNKPHKSIQRFTKLLDDATLKSGTPPTWSPRFDHFGQVRIIEGILGWGHNGNYAHNKLYLCSLKKNRADLDTVKTFHIYRDGIDTSQLEWNELNQYLRWFRYNVYRSANGMVALEEWTKSANGPEYIKSYAVFDSETGEEVKRAPPSISPFSVTLRYWRRFDRGPEFSLKLDCIRRIAWKSRLDCRFAVTELRRRGSGLNFGDRAVAID